jgi:hypothetical protein
MFSKVSNLHVRVIQIKPIRVLHLRHFMFGYVSCGTSKCYRFQLRRIVFEDCLTVHLHQQHHSERILCLTGVVALMGSMSAERIVTASLRGETHCVIFDGWWRLDCTLTRNDVLDVKSRQLRLENH